jgi:hypothetical protein
MTVNLAQRATWSFAHFAARRSAGGSSSSRPWQVPRRDPVESRPKAGRGGVASVAVA